MEELRAAVSPDFAKIPGGIHTWFPSQLFISAMIERLPGLKDFTTMLTCDSTTGAKVEQHILLLLVTYETDLETLIKANGLKFAFLPKVLIIRLEKFFSSRYVELPRIIKLVDMKGVPAWYELRATIEEDYALVHSTAHFQYKDGPWYKADDEEVVPIYDQQSVDTVDTDVVFYELFSLGRAPSVE